MTNVYEGPPDARQSDDTQHPTSRFRPTYRALSDAEKSLHDQIKREAETLEALFEEVAHVRGSSGPDQARYHALALTALEQAVMWAVKGLTA